MYDEVNSTRKCVFDDATYAILIQAAIMASSEKRLTLDQIYKWMKQNVPTLKDRSKGEKTWKNSIRHNLSYHGQFVRVVSDTSRSFWTFDPNRKGIKRSTSMDPKALEGARQRARSNAKKNGKKNSGKVPKGKVPDRTSRLCSIPSQEVLSSFHQNTIVFQNYNATTDVSRARSFSTGSAFLSGYAPVQVVAPSPRQEVLIHHTHQENLASSPRQEVLVHHSQQENFVNVGQRTFSGGSKSYLRKCFNKIKSAVGVGVNKKQNFVRSQSLREKSSNALQNQYGIPTIPEMYNVSSDMQRYRLNSMGSTSPLSTSPEVFVQQNSQWGQFAQNQFVPSQIQVQPLVQSSINNTNFIGMACGNVPNPINQGYLCQTTSYSNNQHVMTTQTGNMVTNRQIFGEIAPNNTYGMSEVGDIDFAALSNDFQHRVTIEPNHSPEVDTFSLRSYNDDDYLHQLASAVSDYNNPETTVENPNGLQDIDNIEIDNRAGVDCNIAEVIKFELGLDGNLDFN
uniref:Forkhead box protein O1-like n=1 Tax=Diabrotica virgifera virgifera TaxID=50390 RepID=A0A6P7G0I8_DIAVI